MGRPKGSKNKAALAKAATKEKSSEPKEAVPSIEEQDEEAKPEVILQSDRGITSTTPCKHCGNRAVIGFNPSIRAYVAYCLDVDGCGCLIGPCATRAEAQRRWERTPASKEIKLAEK